MNKKEKGRRVSIWVTHKLFELIEEERIKLGLSRSSFIKYSLVTFIVKLKKK